MFYRIRLPILMKRIYLVMICSMPLMVYNFGIGGLNLSLDRFLFLVVASLFFLYVLLNKIEIKHMSILFFSMLFVLVLLSQIFVSDLELFLKLSPSLIQSIVVYSISIIIISNFVSYKDEKRILEIIFFLVLIFQVFTFYKYFVVNEPINYLPLSGILGSDVELDKHKIDMMSSFRFFLPFSAAPRLGFVVGFLGLHFLIDFFRERSNKYLIFYSLASICCLLTFSRSALLAYIICTILILFNYYGKNILTPNKQILRIGTFYVVALIALIGLFDYLVGVTDSDAFFRIFNFDFDNASLGQHSNIRILAIESFWEAPLLKKILGYGLGSSIAVFGISSAHMTYLTFLVEAGIIGALYFISVMFYPLFLYLTKNKNKRKLGYAILAFFLILCHAFYDAISLSILWFYSGLITARINK